MKTIGLTVVVLAARLILHPWDTSGMGQHVRECPQSRFGQNCQYMCHCREEGACHPVTGSCGSSGCANGYLGDGCQYVNLAFNANVGPENKALVDGDSLTCVDLHAHYIRWIELTHRYWLRRLRISIDGLTDKSELNVGISNSTFKRPEMTSRNIRVTWTEDGAAEIFFKQAVRGQYIWIQGEGFMVCEVYAYGGRNLALFRPTRQSSKYRNLTSSLAVDGNRQSACTYTEPQDKFKSLIKEEAVWWRLNLTAIHVITRVKIYNSDSNPNQLRWFHLLAGSLDDRSLTVVYQSPARYPPRMLEIIPVEPMPMALFQVQLFGKRRILSLCEVELYGDCPDMRYGPMCNLACACTDETEVCDSFSGSCLSNRSKPPPTFEVDDKDPTKKGKNIRYTVPLILVLLILVLCSVVAAVLWRRRGKVSQRYVNTVPATTPTTGEPAQTDETYEVVEASQDSQGNCTLQSVTSRDHKLSDASGFTKKGLGLWGKILRLKLGGNVFGSGNDKEAGRPGENDQKDCHSMCGSLHEYEDADSMGACAKTDGSGSCGDYEPLGEREYETPYSALGESSVPNPDRQPSADKK